MKLQKNFCYYLDNILSILQISNAKIAKVLSVDPSLITRWRKGSRIPPYPSNYIPSLINYLKNFQISKNEQEQINALFNDLKFPSPSLDIYESIEHVLLQAQINTIKMKYTKKSKDQLKEKIIIKSFSNQDKLIIDYENIINTAIELLEGISSIKCQKVNKKIFILLNSDINLFFLFTNESQRLIRALQNALDNGWHVSILFRINQNYIRSLNFINKITPLLAYKNFYAFYYKSSKKYSPISEVLIIPNSAALITLATQNNDFFDSAIYFQTQEAVKICYNCFSLFLKDTQPLTAEYLHFPTDIPQKIFETEYKTGDRYLFKEGFSSLTIPITVFKKYLFNYKKEEIENHKKRLNNFYNQINKHKYIDICTCSFIENLIINNHYSFDNFLLPPGIDIPKEDIILHLQNIIYMLRNFTNYNLIFVNKNHLQNISSCLIVKNQFCILNKNHHYLFLKEKSLINFLSKSFEDLYSNIPAPLKDKNNIIAFLENIIELISCRE